MKRKRWITRIAVLLVVAGATLAVCALPYTAFVRNARFARLSLEEQLRQQEQHFNDPLFLYHFGRNLNARQRFKEALPVLERAVGLDPEYAASRDEWARAQLGCGRVSDAYVQLRQFVGTHPKSAAAHFLMGKFYVTQENLHPARHALETTVTLDSNQPEAWSLLAHVRIKMGNGGGAREALESAIRLRPDAADDHLQLGVLFSNSDPGRARREFTRALELAPNSAVCHRQYGRFLLDRGEVVLAEQEARRAIELDGGDSFAAFLLGRCLVEQKQPEAALPYLRQAAALAPADPLPADILRRAYRTLGDRDNQQHWEARYKTLTQYAAECRRLKNVTSASPEDSGAHRRLAAALARTGDVNGCVREHAFAGKTTPDSVKALSAAARDLDRAGYSAQALPLIRQALRGAQQSPDAFETLGDILVHLGRLHEAAIQYDRIRDWRAEKRPLYRKRLAEAAARLASSSAPAERLLRQAQRETDPAATETLLQQALALEPENTRCLRMLLRLQFARQQSEAALATAQRLIAISPEDGVAHTLLVVLWLERQGDRSLSAEEVQALETHLKAAEPDLSVTPTILYGRGILALKRGQTEAAIRDLERAARLDPNALAVYPKLAEAKTKAGDAEGAKQALAEFERHRRARITEHQEQRSVSK
jgi:tetratricopeptide (TPR) repeat protein